jgi:hypothetical protein
MSGHSLIRRALGCVALTSIFSAACRDSVSPPNVSMRGLAPRSDVSVAAAPGKTILPTGKGFGINNDPNPPQRAKYRIEYHDQPVLTGPQNVYFIWYGDWSNRSNEQTIVGEMVATIGNTP